jgi:hypothetical protein
MCLTARMNGGLIGIKRPLNKQGVKAVHKTASPPGRAGNGKKP